MVHYTEWASEGLAHHFAVESDELTLKTNARCCPLSAYLPTKVRPGKRRLIEPTAAAQPDGSAVASAAEVMLSQLRQIALAQRRAALVRASASRPYQARISVPALTRSSPHK
jgi:hypothetical protein